MCSLLVAAVSRGDATATETPVLCAVRALNSSSDVAAAGCYHPCPLSISPVIIPVLSPSLSSIAISDFLVLSCHVFVLLFAGPSVAL